MARHALNTPYTCTDTHTSCAPVDDTVWRIVVPPAAIVRYNTPIIIHSSLYTTCTLALFMFRHSVVPCQNSPNPVNTMDDCSCDARSVRS